MDFRIFNKNLAKEWIIVDIYTNFEV